jgi:hypothetical protein
MKSGAVIALRLQGPVQSIPVWEMNVREAERQEVEAWAAWQSAYNGESPSA